MATHSSILAWRITWTEEPGSPWSHKELDMTEQLTLLLFFLKKKLSSIANGKSDIEIGVTKESSQKAFEGTELKSLSGYYSFIH